jgi:putative effector of murein hydrolase
MKILAIVIGIVLGIYLGGTLSHYLLYDRVHENFIILSNTTTQSEVDQIKRKLNQTWAIQASILVLSGLIGGVVGYKLSKRK